MAILPDSLENTQSEPGLHQQDAVGGNPSKKRAARIVRVVTSFVLGQGTVQIISIFASIVLVRRLSFEAYAQFSITNGLQLVFATLMDMGFASTIVPMVGEHRDDLTLVGRYVRAAKHLRDLSFWTLAPITAVAFLTIMHRQHWNWRIQTMLLASVLLALYSGGKVAYFSAPLFIQGRLRDYYVPQVITGTGRLLAYLGLAVTGGLTAWTAAALSAVNITLNGSWLERKSRRWLKWPDHHDPVVSRELVRYILPAAPAIIFSAFQSQITLFLISIFGGSVHVAEVAALARIAQLFAVISTFYMIVIEPYVARAKRSKLLAIFAGPLIIAILAFIPVVWTAFTWPKIFLWILGPKYQDLGNVVGWAVLSACMNSVAQLMWIMNRARKWVFWSGACLEVASVLIVQTIYVIIVGVHTTRQAILLNFATSFCYLLAHGYVTLFGFFSDSRRKNDLDALQI